MSHATTRAGLPCGHLAAWAIGLGLLLAGGCKDSSQSAASRDSQQAVDQAGRLLRGTEQSLALTDAEIAAAGQANTDVQRQRVAQQIQDRLQGPEAVRQYQEKLAEIDEAVQKKLDAVNKLIEEKKAAAQVGKPTAPYQAGQRELLPQISAQIMDLNRWIASQQDQIDSLAAAHNQQRLDKARQVLQESIRQAQQADVPPAQIGPELLRGTLALIQQHDNLFAFHQQARRGDELQVQLTGLLTSLTYQKIFTEQLQGQNPQEKIEQLTARLDNGSDALRKQLAQLDQDLQQRVQEKERLIQIVSEQRRLAGELEKKHLQLLDQAEESLKQRPRQNEEYYDLLQQAYEQRLGYGQGASQVHGSIYHEAQADRAENAQKNVQDYCDYIQLQREQLAGTIARIEATLAELSNPTNRAELQSQIEAAQADQQVLREKIVDVFAEFLAAEQHYLKLAQVPAACLEEALDAFDQAAQAARLGRSTELPGAADLAAAGNYAGDLAQRTTAELAVFWQGQAQHFRLRSETVEPWLKNPDIQPAGQPSYDFFVEQARLAEEKAAASLAATGNSPRGGTATP
ncbi:MAG: hypothetical protein JW810_02755 [Sedimentisphaerales bacterium]|nr:hypothetical protein [Sedimentisphaerales bacterium]